MKQLKSFSKNKLEKHEKTREKNKIVRKVKDKNIETRDKCGIFVIKKMFSLLLRCEKTNN